MNDGASAAGIRDRSRTADLIDRLRGSLDCSGTLSVVSRTAGGRLETLRLSDGDRTWILRVGPEAAAGGHAVSMQQEACLTQALERIGMPVPRTVSGGPVDEIGLESHLLTTSVPGTRIRTKDDLTTLDAATSRAMTRELVKTLVQVHRVDHEDLDLSHFWRLDSYAERQVHRAVDQWSRLTGSDPALEAQASEVASQLQSRLPLQLDFGLLHGDFRLDNLVFDLERVFVSVAAVVDWRYACLGDPVGDVAMMCVTRQHGIGWAGAHADGWFPPADDLAAAYETAGGVPLRNWEFHLALASFVLGVRVANMRDTSEPGPHQADPSSGELVELLFADALKFLSRRGAA